MRVFAVSIGLFLGCASADSESLEAPDEPLPGPLPFVEAPAEELLPEPEPEPEPEPVPPVVDPVTDAVRLGVGRNAACVVRADGRLWCWGRGLDGPTLIPGIEDAQEVAAAAFGTVLGCVLTTQRQVQCINLNHSPEGDPMFFVPSVDVPSGVVQVAISRTHACVRTKKGEVWCWGENRDGQLGNGKIDLGTSLLGRRGATRVKKISKATDLALGSRHSCATLRDGTVRCWGRNHLGQIGTGEKRYCTSSHGEGTREDGTSCHMYNPTPKVVLGIRHAVSLLTPTCARVRGDRVRCWGTVWKRSSIGWGGHFSPTPVDPGWPRLDELQAVASGGTHTCMITTARDVVCHEATAETEQAVAQLHDVAELGINSLYGCARTVEGKVECWGHNNFGQLSLPPDDDPHAIHTTPVTVSLPRA